MSQVHRILDARPVSTLAAYERTGGGRALEAARASEPGGIIDVVAAAGLRGRGGAGFPTGRKWGTVVDEAQGRPVTVVVNAAEGEPGTLKDRTLLRRNPYQVLEGALIAAHVVGANHVIVGMKRSRGVRAQPRRRRHRGARGGGVVQGHRRRVRRRLGSLPPRRGDGAARGARRSPAVPAGGAALPRRRRRRSPGDARQQRGDAGQRARHRPRRPGGVPLHGHQRVARHHRLHRERVHASCGSGRVRARHAAGRGAGAARWHLAPRGRGGAVGHGQPDPHGRRARRAALVGGAGGGRRRPRLGRVHRDRRGDRHRGRRPRGLPLPLRGVLRSVHALQAGRAIGLACTLSVWPVLYRFGLYSIGLACTLSVWPVLYRFGLYSIGLACTLSVWPVLYRFGLYSIGLACTLSV